MEKKQNCNFFGSLYIFFSKENVSILLVFIDSIRNLTVKLNLFGKGGQKVKVEVLVKQIYTHVLNFLTIGCITHATD